MHEEQVTLGDAQAAQVRGHVIRCTHKPSLRQIACAGKADDAAGVTRPGGSRARVR